MTMHFSKPNFFCPNCNAIFLPYKTDTKCPRCSVAIPESDISPYLDSVKEIAGSMEMHKRLYGTYTPGAWLTSNIMDHVQSIVFRLFDTLEAKKPENQAKFLENLLEKNFQWGEQGYLKDHIKDITLKVLKIYNAEKFSEIKYSEPLPPTKSEKVKKWFDRFLP